MDKIKEAIKWCDEKIKDFEGFVLTEYGEGKKLILEKVREHLLSLQSSTELSVSEHSLAGDKMKERINYTKSGEYFIGESVNLPLIGQARTVEELKRMMQELFGTYLKRLQQTELEFVGFNQEDKKQQIV